MLRPRPPPPCPPQEHLEDADASQVQGDTVTDREVLEGKGGTPATTST